MDGWMEISVSESLGIGTSDTVKARVGVRVKARANTNHKPTLTHRRSEEFVLGGGFPNPWSL